MTRGNWTDEPCFYVSIIDAGKCALLAGPYRTKEEAEAIQKEATKWAIDASNDPKAVFYAYGVSKWPNGYREGIMQQKGILQ